MACEIDAKPAGHLGFLRVWTGAPATGTPKKALETYLGGEKNVKNAKFSDVKVGGLAATEVVFDTYSELLEETKPQRALAVSTPRGVAVLVLGGLDADENKAMLPAYELAKRTLTPTG